MPRKTVRGVLTGGGDMAASMRPRPDAAENGPRRRPRAARAGCFNEAAARCRGKRLRAADPRAPGAVPASMRPRPDAAENTPSTTTPRRPPWCFNEAAARCRGKPAARRCCATGTGRRFNEAAARCRGKRPGTAPVRAHVREASMRPRPDAAENETMTAISDVAAPPLQ